MKTPINKLKVGDEITVDSGHFTCWHRVTKIEETRGLFDQKQLKITSKPLKIHKTIQILDPDEQITCAPNKSMI